MKFAYYSNSPAAPVTGYGSQSAMLLPRLAAAGHEVVVLANWGQQVGVSSWNGMMVMPQGLEPYSVDVLSEQVEMINPDVVMTLYDVWVLTGKNLWPGRPVVSWTPIDHYPVPPKVAEWARQHKTIAMSRFGQKALADLGIPSTYIPHGIEKVFAPTPSDIRERLRVPNDAYLVMMNAANIGNAPLPRKAWDMNIQALASFAREHEDVYIYLHTDVRRPGGIPIDGLLRFWGVPEDRVRIPDQVVYRMGAVDAEELAKLYSAADVFLGVSHGEGFGIPVVEAELCGTPAIVSDFSAQPELVGDTGWLVAGQLFYDQGQHAAWIMPYIFSIREKLEAAYRERGSFSASTRREATRRHALQYDADTVFDQYWLPYLAELEEQIASGRKQRSIPNPEGNREQRRKARKA